MAAELGAACEILRLAPRRRSAGHDRAEPVGCGAVSWTSGVRTSATAGVISGGAVYRIRSLTFHLENAVFTAVELWIPAGEQVRNRRPTKGYGGFFMVIFHRIIEIL